VTPAADGPETVGANPRAQLHIVNLQSTPLDVFATQRLNGKCDEVMKLVMKELNLEVEPWQMSRGAKVDVSVVEQKMKTTGNLSKASAKSTAKSTPKTAAKITPAPPANVRNSRITAISKNIANNGGGASKSGSKSSSASAAASTNGGSTNPGSAPSISGGRTTILNQTTITPVSAAINISVDGFDPSSLVPFHLFQAADLYFYEEANFSIKDKALLNDLLVNDNVEEISSKYLDALNVAVLKEGDGAGGNGAAGKGGASSNSSTVALRNKILIGRNKTRPLQFSVKEDDHRDVFQIWCKLMAAKKEKDSGEENKMDVENSNNTDAENSNNSNNKMDVDNSSYPDTSAARLYNKLNKQSGALFLRLSFAGHYEEPDLILPILVEDLISAGFNKDSPESLSNFVCGQKSTCMYEMNLSFQQRAKNDIKRWGVSVKEDAKAKAARKSDSNHPADSVSGPWTASADYAINSGIGGIGGGIGGIGGGIGGIGSGIPGVPSFIPGSFSLPPLGNISVDGQHNRAPPSGMTTDASSAENTSRSEYGRNTPPLPAIGSPVTNNASTSSTSSSSSSKTPPPKNAPMSEFDKVFHDIAETRQKCAETVERSEGSLDEFRGVLKGSEEVAAQMDLLKEKMDQVMELGVRRLSTILAQEGRRQARGGKR
jgi:hypothetical protein